MPWRLGHAVAYACGPAPRPGTSARHLGPAPRPGPPAAPGSRACGGGRPVVTKSRQHRLGRSVGRSGACLIGVNRMGWGHAGTPDNDCNKATACANAFGWVRCGPGAWRVGTGLDWSRSRPSPRRRRGPRAHTIAHCWRPSLRTSSLPVAWFSCQLAPRRACAGGRCRRHMGHAPGAEAAGAAGALARAVRAPLYPTRPKRARLASRNNREQ